jgi:hypothetical protein
LPPATRVSSATSEDLGDRHDPILYCPDGQLRTDLTLEDLPSAFADTKGCCRDFEGEPPEVRQPL